MTTFDTVRQTLGNPFFESDNCLIYNIDCIDAMHMLDDDIFDLVITSPPYNIGKSYEEVKPSGQYIQWCVDWMRLIYRITKNHGSFWLNLGYFEIEGKAKAVPISYLLWDKSDFYMMQEVVWHYGAGVAAKKFYSPRNEKFLWYVKNPKEYTFNLDEVRDPDVKYPNQKKNGRIKVNPLGKNPTDVWIFPKVTSGQGRSSTERTAHPAQFPGKVIERIVIASSNLGDIVLDPFMGSGTTAEIAILNGRKVVGFEINLEYCEIIKNRVKNIVPRLL